MPSDFAYCIQRESVDTAPMISVTNSELNLTTILRYEEAKGEDYSLRSIDAIESVIQTSQ